MASTLNAPSASVSEGSELAAGLPPIHPPSSPPTPPVDPPMLPTPRSTSATCATAHRSAAPAGDVLDRIEDGRGMHVVAEGTQGGEEAALLPSCPPELLLGQLRQSSGLTDDGPASAPGSPMSPPSK